MERLKKQLTDAGICVKTEYPLSAHSSFRIGGAARLAVFPRTREELLFCLCAVQKNECPYLVIGNASNVVFSDAGFNGAILFTGAFRETVRAGNKLHVSAGASLTAVANMAQTEGLSGAEFAYGIPGRLAARCL